MDLRLAMMGVLAACGGVALGTLVQVGKSALAESEIEAHAAALRSQSGLSLGGAGPEGSVRTEAAGRAAPELAEVAHGINRLARQSGARLLLRDCGAPPCLVHLSWADDRDLRAEAALEHALHGMGWAVRGQSTVVEAPGDGRWFSHYAAVIWPAELAPAESEQRAELERVRNVLRAAVR